MLPVVGWNETADRRQFVLFQFYFTMCNGLFRVCMSGVALIAEYVVVTGNQETAETHISVPLWRRELCTGKDILLTRTFISGWLSRTINETFSNTSDKH